MGAVSGLSPRGATTGAVLGTLAGGPVGTAIGAGVGGSGMLPGSAGPLGGLIGAAGGINGTGISGPNEANIERGVTLDQTGKAYAGVQQGLDQQQALLKALQGQNAIGKQSAVFDQGQKMANRLNEQDSIDSQTQARVNQQQLAAQQQGLVNQYQDIANGAGPNPAQAMLNNATGQNVANQAALMAGQRGAGANVGLMARQAAMQGSGIQQQAAGQAAQMQAQQQLGALGQIGAQQQAIGNTNQNMASIAAQQVAEQQAAQQALAAQAAGQVGQQANATTALSQGQQNQQQTLLGGLGAQNNAAVGMQGNINAANAGIAGAVTQGQQGIVGGLMNGAGAAMGMKAQGGLITRMADGGAVPQAQPKGPASSFGQFLQGWSSGMTPQEQGQPDKISSMGNQSTGAQALNNGMTSIGKGINTMRNKPMPVGPGQAMAGPDATGSAGLMTALAARGGMAERGGRVTAKSPGQKAVKPGDSYANDKIPTILSEKEIVLPRSVTMSSDPVRSAADFVAKVMAKRRRAS